MSTTTKEISHFERFDNSFCDNLAKGEGSKLHSTYFRFNITLPVAVGASFPEISDKELLIEADKTGTFDFLKLPEEEGYNDLISPCE